MKPNGYQISVTDRTYYRLNREAESRGITVAALVDLIVRPELGLPPNTKQRRPRTR